MTWGSSSMSMPRAATSVATRIDTRPALKSLSARTRCDWLRLPWIAAAAIPSFTSCSARRFAPCLVRAKTSAWSTRPERHELAQEIALALPVHPDDDLADEGGRRCSAASPGPARGRAGRPDASCRMSSLKVAEKSRFWRSAGSVARIRRMSRMNPMSSIRSASSRTRTSTAEKSTVRWPMWSRSRPGVATTISGPLRRPAELRLVADAAVDRDRADGPPGAVGPDALLHLERELAGGNEDEDAGQAARRLTGTKRRCQACRDGVEPLEDGQDEGGRLAGARLGACEDVAAGEDERDGLGLDGGGLGVALVRDSAEELGRQPELIEGHGVVLLTGPSRSLAGPGQGWKWIEISGLGRGADRSAHRARRRGAYPRSADRGPTKEGAPQFGRPPPPISVPRSRRNRSMSAIRSSPAGSRDSSTIPSSRST